MADADRTTLSAMELLREHCRGRMTLVDVGARWGVSERWLRLGESVEIIGFEPDQKECDHLNAGRPSNVRYLPVCLFKANGEVDLFVTNDPACSSIYPPIRALYENVPALGVIAPKRTAKMLCRRLDDVLAEEICGAISALKLDTQGSELAILQGSPKTLENCCLIDIEVEFNPIYSGQGLFCNVDYFLRCHGFVLWRLENLVHYPTELVPNATSPFVISSDPNPATVANIPNGQIYWAQAQYVRADYPRTGVEHMTLDQAIVPAILAGVYGFWDLSLELIRKTGEGQLLQKLRDCLAC